MFKSFIKIFFLSSFITGHVFAGGEKIEEEFPHQSHIAEEVELIEKLSLLSLESDGVVMHDLLEENFNPDRIIAFLKALPYIKNLSKRVQAQVFETINRRTLFELPNGHEVVKALWESCDPETLRIINIDQVGLPEEQTPVHPLFSAGGVLKEIVPNNYFESLKTVEIGWCGLTSLEWLPWLGAPFVTDLVLMGGNVTGVKPFIKTGWPIERLFWQNQKVPPHNWDPLERMNSKTMITGYCDVSENPSFPFVMAKCKGARIIGNSLDNGPRSSQRVSKMLSDRYRNADRNLFIATETLRKQARDLWQKNKTEVLSDFKHLVEAKRGELPDSM